MGLYLGLCLGLYLGVDAGGTKTDYLLADDVRELGRVRGGTIKRLRVDAEMAAANLDAALGELATQAGVDLRGVARTCVGTAGEGVPVVADWVRAAFAARVGGELEVVGDVEIALDAAFAGGAGVLVLAGTGSNVAARFADGRLTTAGGWGPVLGDEGSGHRIGLEGLRAAFLARDEGRECAILPAVVEFWGLDKLERLVELANRSPQPDFSQLAGLVLRCAEAGDVIAGAVLEAQGRQLGALARLVMRRVRSRELAFAGGIAESVGPVREAVVAAVRREFPEVRARAGVVDPVAGALWRARRGGHRESSA